MVSEVTKELIYQLEQRDAAGLKKYGTTLDRTDLAVDDWIQHTVEELLDAAGYLLSLKRARATVAQMVRDTFKVLDDTPRPQYDATIKTDTFQGKYRDWRPHLCSVSAVGHWTLIVGEHGATAHKHHDSDEAAIAYAREYAAASGYPLSIAGVG